MSIHKHPTSLCFLLLFFFSCSKQDPKVTKASWYQDEWTHAKLDRNKDDGNTEAIRQQTEKQKRNETKQNKTS